MLEGQGGPSLNALSRLLPEDRMAPGAKGQDAETELGAEDPWSSRPFAKVARAPGGPSQAPWGGCPGGHGDRELAGASAYSPLTGYLAAPGFSQGTTFNFFALKTSSLHENHHEARGGGCPPSGRKAADKR